MRELVKSTFAKVSYWRGGLLSEGFSSMKRLATILFSALLVLLFGSFAVDAAVTITDGPTRVNGSNDGSMPVTSGGVYFPNRPRNWPPM